MALQKLHFRYGDNDLFTATGEVPREGEEVVVAGDELVGIHKGKTYRVGSVRRTYLGTGAHPNVASQVLAGGMFACSEGVVLVRLVDA